MQSCAKRSSIFKDFFISQIPNGLDVDVFSPKTRERVRNVLGLPLDKKVILFGAVDASADPNKGFYCWSRP